jgi:hypothetical protein
LTIIAKKTTTTTTTFTMTTSGSYSSHAGTRDYKESDINFDALISGGENNFVEHEVPGKGFVRLQDGWATGVDDGVYYFYNEATGEERELGEVPLYKIN